jgi:hypothetical protein
MSGLSQSAFNSPLDRGKTKSKVPAGRAYRKIALHLIIRSADHLIEDQVGLSVRKKRFGRV